MRGPRTEGVRPSRTQDYVLASLATSQRLRGTDLQFGHISLDQAAGVSRYEADARVLMSSSITIKSVSRSDVKRMSGPRGAISVNGGS